MMYMHLGGDGFGMMEQSADESQSVYSKSMNLQSINDTYGRKSPIFLVEIITLISTLIIRSYPSHNPTFNTFTLVVLILSALELLIKGVNLPRYCHFQNTHVEGYVTIVFAVVHVGLLVYGGVLFVGKDYREKYERVEPQWFYLKVYVLVYSSVVLGLVLSVLVTAVLSYCLLRKRSNNAAE